MFNQNLVNLASHFFLFLAFLQLVSRNLPPSPPGYLAKVAEEEVLLLVRVDVRVVALAGLQAGVVGHGDVARIRGARFLRHQLHDCLVPQLLVRGTWVENVHQRFTPIPAQFIYFIYYLFLFFIFTNTCPVVRSP